MTRPVSEIEEEIRRLDPADRYRLIRDLIADMDGVAEPGVEAAWIAEAHRRHAELKSGAATSVPAEDAIRRARARIRDEG